ncbi:MAG: hypothetical protein AB1609_15330 [Bacillota bacterium]
MGYNLRFLKVRPDVFLEVERRYREWLRKQRLAESVPKNGKRREALHLPPADPEW